MEVIIILGLAALIVSVVYNMQEEDSVTALVAAISVTVIFFGVFHAVERECQQRLDVYDCYFSIDALRFEPTVKEVTDD